MESPARVCRGTVFVFAAALVLAAAPAAGQSSGGTNRWFPDVQPFDRLVAAPREVQFRGSFIGAARELEGDFGGRNVEAEVAVGIESPLVRLDHGTELDGAVVLGFDVGVWSRFFIEESTRDLINVDYRVAFPVEWRRPTRSCHRPVRHSTGNATR